MKTVKTRGLRHCLAGLGICAGMVLATAPGADAGSPARHEGRLEEQGAKPLQPRQEGRKAADSSADPNPVGDDSLCADLEEIDDLEKILARAGRLGDYARQHVKPADEVLDGPALQRYRALIERRDCEAALYLLQDPYLLAHPDQGCFFRSSRGAGHLLSKRYPELSLCRLEVQFADDVAQLEREGVEAPPYTPDDFPWAAGRPWPVTRRNATLLGLFSACFLGIRYQPACVSYARIALTTKHLVVPDQDLYFILEKARMLEGDSPEIARLRAVLEPKISGSQRRQLQEWAREAIAREAQEEAEERQSR